MLLIWTAIVKGAEACTSYLVDGFPLASRYVRRAAGEVFNCAPAQLNAAAPKTLGDVRRMAWVRCASATI
jgi:hypothetical protein